MDVHAVQIPPTSFDGGLGFASVQNVMMMTRDTQVYANPGDVPMNDLEASIVLPAEIRTLYRNAGKKAILFKT